MERLMSLLRGVGIAAYFLLADTVWITQFATNQYSQQLGDMLKMAEGPKLLIGLVAAYALLLVGLFVFVLTPDTGLLKSVLFGMVVYGVYGFTNWLILDRWSIELVMVDFLWGGFLYGSSAYLARLINYL